MKYYFSARYSDRALMRQYRQQLLAVQPDAQVVSCWIDHDSMSSLRWEMLQGQPEAVWYASAHLDVLDLMAADTVVSFSCADGGGRGGRHVEFGMALALDKSLVLIGVREHVFHTAPRVQLFDTFDDFLSA